VTAVLASLDRWQRRHRWLAFPFAVVKKFGDDQAGNLAALIAYYAFFSIFPLLLVLSTVLGYVLHGHPDWQKTVTDSALSNLPLIGNNHPAPLHGNIGALIVGLLLALWSGLGVAKTAQSSFDTVYLVPRTDRPNFVAAIPRSLRIVVVGGLGLVTTTALSSAVTSVHALGSLELGPGLRVIGTVLAIAFNTALFATLFRWLTVRRIRWRDVLPGAVIAAVALQLFQLLATAFIAHKLKGANATYGNFGAVIVLLSWFYLQAQVVLFAAEVNVVRQYRLWPKSISDPPADTQEPATDDR
jgi:YihY family inner membrane protein